jgi:hypothetical protein
VVLADYATVADGKLTLVGAGFDWCHAVGPVTFGIGVLVHVPWTATNTRHDWVLRIIDGDGRPVAGSDGDPLEIGDRFELGRPPGVPAGSSMTFPLACNLQGLPLEAETRYLVELAIDGELVARGSFATRS